MFDFMDRTVRYSTLRVAVDALPPNEELGNNEPPKSMVEAAVEGIFQPVIRVVENASGQWRVIDGRRSLKAVRYAHAIARELGLVNIAQSLSEVEVLVYTELDAISAATIDIMTDTVRSVNERTQLERIIELLDLGLTHENIRSMIRANAASYRRLTSPLGLKKELLGIFLSGKMDFGVAVKAAKLNQPQQDKLWAEYTERLESDEKARIRHDDVKAVKSVQSKIEQRSLLEEVDAYVGNNETNRPVSQSVSQSERSQLTDSDLTDRLAAISQQLDGLLMSGMLHGYAQDVIQSVIEELDSL